MPRALSRTDSRIHPHPHIDFFVHSTSPIVSPSSFVCARTMLVPLWRASAASSWKTSYRRLHSCVGRLAEARTVRLESQRGTGRPVAHVLQEVCSGDAGSYVVARDNHGRPLSLGDSIDSTLSSLTFLPFEADDKLAQRTFWLSSAYVLTIALNRVCGPIICDIPSVKESSGAHADGMSGYVVEFLRVPSLPTIELGEHSFRELRAQVEQSIQILVDEQRQVGAPKVSPEEVSSVDQFMKQLCAKSFDFQIARVNWKEAWTLFKHNPLLLRSIVSYGEQDALVPVVYMGHEACGVLPLNEVLLRRTKPIKAAKVLGWSTSSLPVAGMSDESTQPLLRVRGISFPSAQDLQQYSARMSELEKSDHRHLGIAQGLFFAHDSSPGSPFVMPHGMRLLRKVERVIRDLYDTFGYDEVQTPQLFRSSLWKQSGHWEKYREDMFSAQGFSCCGAHDDVFGLKPMNCPGHCVMFAHQPRSYRELPMRLAEFSPLHRNEASGALSGLTRVRRFHQDDAHVFCTPAQVATEIESMLHMLSLAYRVFGFGDRFELVLSTRPPNFLGQVEAWDHAEASLKEALDASGKPWTLNEGDGAFYGPKIDIRLVDAMGRKHQTATIQLDFQLPERFGLEYATSSQVSSTEQVRPGYARPVMIHRAILGSFERFLAILVEQCKGWWPFWLSPRQAVVIPAFSGNEETHQAVADYAAHVQYTLSGHTHETRETRSPFLSPTMAHQTLQVPSRTRFQIELPPQSLVPAGDTLGKKVRHAQLSRFNFFLIVGPQEAKNYTVSVRMRDEKAAPAWHAGEDAFHTMPCKIQDLTWAVIKATFPDRYAAHDAKMSLDLGTWTLPDLWRLFCVLDALHV